MIREDVIKLAESIGSPDDEYGGIRFSEDEIYLFYQTVLKNDELSNTLAWALDSMADYLEDTGSKKYQGAVLSARKNVNAWKFLRGK